ncbi:unnamed protein product [Orchesella dallaii]|uniref:Reverse transcriptase domain-containing protein n=1 Tax=Orchesella dallaii TaxID=48710 RepID=A0ABP1QEU2_9HEXA
MVERATTTTPASARVSELSAKVSTSTIQDIKPEIFSQAPDKVEMVRIAGHIRFKINEWRRLTSDKVVLSAVLGFEIPFTSVPLQHREPSYRNLLNTDVTAINDCISKLLVTQAIEKCIDETGQFISTVFTVPKSDGSNRFVINLKELNKFVDSPHFKMEDIRMVMSLLKQNYYMVVLDQCEAFHRIPIVSHHKKYLRFRWEGQLYQFICLPFGLNVSPWLFTKMMKPVFGSLRAKGHESVSYLDDSLLFGKNTQDCITNRSTTIKLCENLGLHINYKKSQLEPSQRVKYLGFIFDSNKLTIELPPSKVETLKSKCINSLRKQTLSIHDLAELSGYLNAATPAMKYSPLYIRELENIKTVELRNHNGNYSAKVSLNDRARLDLQWWLKAMEKPYQLIPNDSYDITLFSDASMSGWGATDTINSTKGSWSSYQQSLHINELELLAVYYGIQALVKIQNISILLRVDNTTAVSYINRYGGCRATQCHEIARMIWEYCESKNLSMRASYVNTKSNIADALSRSTRDSSDFSLNKSYFEKICTTFFHPEIDLFASYLTRKCHRYMSWLPDPESEVVDAFTTKWQNRFYAFPPFNMIAKVLRKIELDGVYGIVVVPVWPTQAWYPRFLDMILGKPIKLKPSKNSIFCPYQNRSHELSNKTTLLAAVLCSSAIRTFTFQAK